LLVVQKLLILRQMEGGLRVHALELRASKREVGIEADGWDRDVVKDI
jgi:hypothetical protein